jgi:hypothetical protein
MHNFHIEPHVGIGPVCLGASRSDVRRALSAIGFPLKDTRGALDYFCGAAIQVEFDDQQRADFIGFASHEAYSVFYCGLNVFDTPAQDLFAFVADRDGTGAHSYSDVEYCFPGQILTLWEADSQYDRLGCYQRVIWAQVGLGTPEYFKAISDI